MPTVSRPRGESTRSTPPDEPGGPTSGGPPAIAFSLTALLIGAGRAAQRELDAALSEHGLTMRHLGALGHLSRQPDLSYSDLGRRAGVTSQSMHATVRQLEELGAVRREHAGQGHRARLEVTDRGRELLGEANAAVEQIDRDLFDGLGEAEREVLRNGLRDVALPDGAPRPG